jgi:ABC-type multidrug transport system fused ATPase/permease subunit
LIFLDKGEISGLGSYDELFEQNEKFRTLVMARET